jgi:hypothetical protein
MAGEATEGSREETGAAASAKGTIEEARREILAEVIAGVRASASPVPLEALADRALRALGHERTIATGWAGAGSFRELLRRCLPDEIKLTGDPPYLAFDAKRHQDARTLRTAAETGEPQAEASALSRLNPQRTAAEEASAPAVERPEPDTKGGASRSAAPVQPEGAQRPEAQLAPSRGAGLPQAPAARSSPQRLDPPSPIQQSIARIQEACQAPPLAPQEYRELFEIMAKEINDHDLFGVQMLNNIAERSQERGIELRRDDVRFVLEVVSEADPWFEQGASADLFASRFRTFVVARCRGQGLNLSADELDLIDAWFLGAGMSPRAVRGGAARPTPAIAAPQASGSGGHARTPEGRDAQWWSFDDGRSYKGELRETTSSGQDAEQSASAIDELPRVVRTRLRG